ncbi:MAG: leucine-rich repeat domain-containing protein [Candidatus Helarchaeota archaeon]
MDNLQRKSISELKSRGYLASEDYKIDNLGIVREIRIRNKGLSEIPEVFKNFIDITKIDLRDNDILKIENLENCKKLESLLLSNNKINKINGLQNLANLKELFLNNNEILKIEGLENNQDLKKLDLSANKIKKIQGLENLSQLKQLWLGKNPLNDDDLMLFRNGIRAVIEKCKKIKNEQLIREAEIKKKKLEYIEKINEHRDKDDLQSFINDIEDLFEDIEQTTDKEVVNWLKNKIQELKIELKEKEYEEQAALKSLETDSVITEPNIQESIITEKATAERVILEPIISTSTPSAPEVKKIATEKENKNSQVETLKQMMKVSTKLKFATMQKALEMNESEFIKNIFKWAEEFGFTIEEDAVVFNKDTFNDFIDMLDSQFDTWEEKENSKEGKN